jgi:hypothetical protein
MIALKVLDFFVYTWPVKYYKPGKHMKSRFRTCIRQKQKITYKAYYPLYTLLQN